MIVKVGLSHRTAALEVREKIALSSEQIGAFLNDIKPEVGEALVLSTCNRVEVYATNPEGRSPSTTGEAIIRALVHRSSREITPALKVEMGTQAVRHLFRVAASLDSLVVGEPQILGQLKDAMALATELGTVGPVLHRALSRAFFVGKRVRTETEIGAGQVSVSSLAVDLAAQVFGAFEDRTALLVGAGEMAETAARLLVKEGARLIVANRSLERAARLASDVGGIARSLDDLPTALTEADIVISSTASPGYVIDAELIRKVRKARRGRPLFLIDIAVPRDIDPTIHSQDGIYLYDIDDLEEQVALAREGRAHESDRAEEIVETELRSFESKAHEATVNPVIVGLRTRMRSALETELERSLSGKLRGLGPREREALAVMIEAATNRFCHLPSARLRRAAQTPRGTEIVDVLREIFDLGADGAPESADPGLSLPPPQAEAVSPFEPPASREEAS